MAHGLLIDMDGVIYGGNVLIPGADKFIERLLKENIPFTFMTNNSQRTRRDVATRLNRMGIEAELWPVNQPLWQLGLVAPGAGKPSSPRPFAGAALASKYHD